MVLARLLFLVDNHYVCNWATASGHLATEVYPIFAHARAHTLTDLITCTLSKQKTETAFPFAERNQGVKVNDIHCQIIEGGAGSLLPCMHEFTPYKLITERARMQ